MFGLSDKRKLGWPLKACLILLSLGLQGCAGSPLYVLVIDQNGAPVPNFKVICGSYSGGYISRGSFSDCSSKTNSKGMFYANESDSSLTLYKIDRLGYESKRVTFSLGANGWAYPNTDISTKEKPFLYHVWRGEPEALMHYDDRYRFERDGSSYSISLTSGEKYPTTFLDDIQIQFIAEQGKNLKRTDWKVIFRVKDGGLQESDDPFMYLAPKEGYQQKTIVEQRKDDAGYKNGLKKSYYLVSRSGKLYARLEMEIIPFYNDYSMIHLRYWANPNGSRNLMYDEMSRLRLSEDAYYEEGKQFLDLKKYAAAMNPLRIAAKHGDKRASTLIGHMYFRGLGVPKDNKVALEWYLDAASSPVRGASHFNDIGYFGKKKIIDEATYMLGVMYKDGIGVSKSIEEAMKWFKNSGYRGTFAVGEYYSKSKKKEDLITSYCWLRHTEYYTEPHVSDKFGKLGNAEYYQRAIDLGKAVSKKLSSEEIEVGESMKHKCGPPMIHIKIIRP